MPATSADDSPAQPSAAVAANGRRLAGKTRVKTAARAASDGKAMRTSRSNAHEASMAGAMASLKLVAARTQMRRFKACELRNVERDANGKSTAHNGASQQGGETALSLDVGAARSQLVHVVNDDQAGETVVERAHVRQVTRVYA